jgi:hypothetical protein
MDIETIGFLILVIGVVMLVLSAYVNMDWLRYISVAILIVGALVINYRKIIGGT